MKANHVLITMFMLSILTIHEVQAKTNYGADCGSCHNMTSGRFQVAQENTVVNLNVQLDGNQRGPLKTFVVNAGSTVTISANVLNAQGTWHLVVSGLERGGQLNSLSNHLNYQPGGGWTSQGSSPSYYTKLANSTGLYSFSLNIDAGTPEDIYDVTFGMGGRDGSRLYQEEHFYIQVVSTTVAEPLVVLSPNGGETLTAGNTYQITWNGGANDDLIWIDCTTDNGSSWNSIASGIPNSGSYNWLIPSINASSAVVRINSSTDSDFSDNPFAIEWNPPSPVISGSVNISGSGIPLANVLVSANNNGDSSYTDSSGNYSITVPYGWSGVVTPSIDDYEFNPSSKTYDNITSNITNQDYIAISTIPDVLNIEGIILSSSEPIEGVLVWIGNESISTYTDSSGYYSLTVPYGWSGVVTPSMNDYEFNPTSKTYNNITSNITNENYNGTMIIPDSLLIEGFITTTGYEPVAGVLVWTNDHEDSTYTDSSGYYSLMVPYGWSGIVTPSKADYQFDPPLGAYSDIKANQDNNNYIGTNKINLCPTISGLILSSDMYPVPGVLVSAGHGGGLAYTNSFGYYSLTVPYGWSGVVTPYKINYVFDSPLITYDYVTFGIDNQDYIGTGTPSGEIIIDNGDPGTSAVSTWQSQAGGDSYGQNALYNNNQNGSYKYSKALSGTYEILMWWTNGIEQLGEATVKVLDGEILLDTLQVDQSLDGGKWNLIGSFDFHNEANVIIESFNSTTMICADALKLVSTPKPMLPVITIDNGNPGTSLTGQWITLTDGIYYGTDFLYSNSINSSYTFEALLSGTYEVQIWIPSTNGSSKTVTIEIYDGEMLIDTKFVTQPQNVSCWYSLDKYIFLQGTAKVKVKAEELNSIVDAVRFIP